MKIKNLLLNSCALSVLITSVFFLFAKISAPEIIPAIQIGKYFLVLLFSLVIVGATLLFSIKRLNKLIALLIHYAISLVAFLLTFISFDESRPMRTLIFIVFFTLLYAAIFAASIGIEKALKKVDRHLEKKTVTTKVKSEYKPRYK